MAEQSSVKWYIDDDGVVATEKMKHESECKIEKLEQLSEADHVVLVLNEKLYCHCIVESVNSEKKVLEIIYYDDGKVECGIEELVLLKGDSEKCERKAGAKRSTVMCEDQSKFEIYKVVYGEDEKCLSSELTLAKAREFLGQEKYNAFENNDEHFAIYCKTGKAGKLFILDPGDIKPSEIFGGNLAKKLTGSLASTGTSVILVNTAKHIASRFPRSVAASALPAVAEAAGSVIGIGIEGVTMGYDIHKKYKANKAGKITDMKFKKYIAKRVTRGTFGVAGGIGGGIVGQMVIPVPVVGALVGGFVGGLLGAAIGHGQGILIGELVEKIDTKIKENEVQKAKEQQEQKYDVLGNLVINFDNYMENMRKATEEQVADESRKSIINNEDFDIYMISNIEDALDHSSLDKATIEDVELPLDLNLYISLPPSSTKM